MSKYSFKDHSNRGDTLVTGESTKLISSNLYHKDVALLTELICLLSIFLCLYVFYVVYVRQSFDVALYIRCCNCIKIPQRSSVNISFKIIGMLTLLTFLSWLFMGIHGSIEFRNSLSCTAGACYCFFYPHYGMALLIVISILIFILKRKYANKIDVPLSNKSMKYYYPENVERMNSPNCTIQLRHYMSLTNTTLNLIILLSLILSFQNSNLASVFVISNNTTIQSQFVPFGWNTSNIKTINNDSPTTNLEIFQMISQICKYVIPILILNNIILLFKFARIIIKFPIISKCNVITTKLTVFLQFILFNALLVCYYYAFNQYYKTEIQYNNSISIAKSSFTSNTSAQLWIPDFGLIFFCIIEFNLIRLLYKTYKHMLSDTEQHIPVRYSKSQQKQDKPKIFQYNNI